MIYIQWNAQAFISISLTKWIKNISPLLASPFYLCIQAHSPRRSYFHDHMRNSCSPTPCMAAYSEHSFVSVFFCLKWCIWGSYRNVFLLTTKEYSIVWIYCHLFINSLVGGHIFVSKLCVFFLLFISGVCVIPLSENTLWKWKERMLQVFTETEMEIRYFSIVLSLNLCLTFSFL